MNPQSAFIQGAASTKQVLCFDNTHTPHLHQASNAIPETICGASSK